jgi:hypothetical protein
MTENSASLGVLPRASPTRNEPTSRGGVSTTFQAGQSLPMCARLRRDKAVIWRMSDLARLDGEVRVDGAGPSLQIGVAVRGSVGRASTAFGSIWPVPKS